MLKLRTQARAQRRLRKIQQNLDRLMLKRMGIRTEPVEGLRPNPAFRSLASQQVRESGAQGGQS